MRIPWKLKSLHFVCRLQYRQIIEVCNEARMRIEGGV